MSNDIVGQGLELMLYGMGTVVVFLALLVVVTTGMSRFLARYFPEAAVAAPARAASPQQAAAGGEVNEDVVVAISAAIRQHRQDRS
jgi:oxaloacetate decarboxylase gamma subunit